MELLKLSMTVIFSPRDAFRMIKSHREKFNILPAFFLLFLALAVRIADIYSIHYPLAGLLPADSNMLLETVKILVPVLTWVVACFAVTSIMSGESTMQEILMAAAYSMMPYIIFTLPVALLSHILSRNETGLYNGIQIIIWVWIILLFLTSVKVMNDYSIKWSVTIFLMNIIGMLIIWAIFLLLFALVGQVYYFIQGIITEIKMLLME